MNPKERAERFLLSCIQDGLAHSFDTLSNTWVKPYPEVTGYLLSYFSSKKSIPLKILHSADGLLILQRPSGGFPSFYNINTLYTFDTAQIAHGLASVYKKTKQRRFLKAAVRAGDFIRSMQMEDGSYFPMYETKPEAMYVEQKTSDGTNWGSCFSHIQVKNAEVLLLLHSLTKGSRFKESALRLHTWARNHDDHRYTHPFGYFLEGMYALHEHAYVRAQLKKHVDPLEKNGFIPYSKHLPYAYVSGSIQLGILYAKTGNLRAARRIYSWAAELQSHHSSGGLFQYATKDGSPHTRIHAELNSWGTKYFLELSRCLHI